MENENDINIKEYTGKLKSEFIARALKMYQKYKSDKAALQERIIANNAWYKSNYAKLINPKTNETQAATPFIFSAIENKYADAIDNFPIPNMLEREPSDSETARVLSKIIPVQLDMSGYKSVYKENWRKKLKYGTAVYGVFYNDIKNDIDIRSVDLLSVYCDMHIKDVQDSQFLFITNAPDNDILKMQYPDFAPLFNGNASVQTQSGSYQLDDKTEIVDCYYKKADGTMHMMKLCGSVVIDATEDIEGYEDGLYSHGLYPVVFDVLYPEDDCPFGFGVVDITRNPQMYIDKLDSVIIKQAIIAGKQRWVIKDNGGINEKEFTDLSRDIIHSSGDVSDNSIRSFQGKPVSEYTLNHRTAKIQELKEIIGNRDFNQGGTTNGVTAASAISALQQTGEKLSRAIIDDSYDAYKKLVIMCIELIRQFYTEERIYRITNELGQTEFTNFSNKQLFTLQYGRDVLGFPQVKEYKRVEFDIDVVPQRQNPFSKEANNQTILALWQQGFFLPDNFDISLMVLQVMNFDGKEKIIDNIKKLQQQMQEQQMQMQEQQAQQAAMQQVQQAQQAQQAAAQQEQQATELETDDELIPIGKVGGADEEDELVPIGKVGG